MTSRRSPLARLVLKLGLALVLTFALLEAMCHFVPWMIPASYRGLYPLHGVGFFEPDLLARTPIDQVPLPLYVGSWDCPPPDDMVRKGLVDPAVNPDPQRFPPIRITVDAMGLPNPEVPEHADVILVGDSFMVGAATTSPVGLRYLLADALEQEVYSLGVTATGPLQQRWLLENQGLPKQPSLVVWFYFGGNDMMDMATTLMHLDAGRRTYADVHAGREPPRLRLPAILRYVLGTKRLELDREYLPPLTLPLGEGETYPMWMDPGYLRSLAVPRATIERVEAWDRTRKVLLEARDMVEAAGARFVFVFLPSKAQVLLPFLEQDAEAIHRNAYFNLVEEPDLSPTEFLRRAHAHRGALESLLREVCATEGIQFVTATPCLEAQARRGELGFFAADSHWANPGQREVLAVLLEALAAR